MKEYAVSLSFPGRVLSLLRCPLSACVPFPPLPRDLTLPFSLYRSLPSPLPSIHLSHSLLLWLHGNCWVIPLTGTAQLIQDPIASDRFSPSPHALLVSF